MKKTVIAILVIGLLPVLAQADLYKWKDKQGRINYTDTPPPADIKADNLKAKPAVPNTPAVVAKEVGKDGKENAKEGEKKDDSKLDDAAAKRQKIAEEQKKLDAEKAEDAKLKEANCKTAKQNMASLANGGRIYRTKNNGEREYMTDQDINNGRKSAQQEVNKYCN